MKKTTSQNLSKRLTQYSALSVAIASTSTINAQELIEYTPPVDFSGTINEYYPLDLDNDGNEDFRIYGFGIGGGTTSAGLALFNGSLMRGLPIINSNSFLGSSATFVYPFALNPDEPIGPTQNTWFSAFNSAGSMNFNGCNGGAGGSNWCGVNDMYLGLRFKIGVDTHYGWVRMDVSQDAFSWTVKDYAYHLEPDTPILAGQTTTLGIDDKDLSEIKIVALSKSIGIYNLYESTNYAIYNLRGKVVLNGSTNQKDYVIEAPSLASGIYIVELNDPKSNAVIRKKVVLQ